MENRLQHLGLRYLHGRQNESVGNSTVCGQGKLLP